MPSYAANLNTHHTPHTNPAPPFSARLPLRQRLHHAPPPARDHTLFMFASLPFVYFIRSFRSFVEISQSQMNPVPPRPWILSRVEQSRVDQIRSDQIGMRYRYVRSSCRCYRMLLLSLCDVMTAC